MRQQLGEKNRAIETRASLVEVPLLDGSQAEALAHVETIVDHLETGTLDVVDESARVYLAAARVSHAATLAPSRCCARVRGSYA